jgi:hypothetical protein
MICPPASAGSVAPKIQGPGSLELGSPVPALALPLLVPGLSLVLGLEQMPSIRSSIALREEYVWAIFVCLSYGVVLACFLSMLLRSIGA